MEGASCRRTAVELTMQVKVTPMLDIIKEPLKKPSIMNVTIYRRRLRGSNRLAASFVEMKCNLHIFSSEEVSFVRSSIVEAKSLQEQSSVRPQRWKDSSVRVNGVLSSLKRSRSLHSTE